MARALDLVGESDQSKQKKGGIDCTAFDALNADKWNPGAGLLSNYNSGN